MDHMSVLRRPLGSNLWRVAVVGLLIESRRRGLETFRLAVCNFLTRRGSGDRILGYGAWMFTKAE